MPICDGCGASFENNFQFCPHCGRATPKPQVDVSAKESIPANACPMCQRNDKVEKVSVIYMHGSHDTTMSIPVTEISSDSKGRTYSTTRNQQVTGLNETKLAQALCPPTAPQTPNKPTHFLAYLIGVGFVSGFPCLFLTGLIIVSFAKIFNIQEFFEPNSQPPLIFYVVLVLFFVLWLFFIFGFSAVFASSSQKSYQKKMSEFNSATIKIWERSMERWNALYFCHRDGQVFILGEKVCVPLEKMREFIVANSSVAIKPR